MYKISSAWDKEQLFLHWDLLQIDNIHVPVTHYTYGTLGHGAGSEDDIMMDEDYENCSRFWNIKYTSDDLYLWNRTCNYKQIFNHCKD